MIDWTKPFEMVDEKYKNIQCSLLYTVNNVCYVILKFQNEYSYSVGNEYETVVTYHEDTGRFSDLTLPRDKFFSIIKLNAFEDIRMVNKGD